MHATEPSVDAKPSKPRFQLNLRALLLITLAMAVGLAIGAGAPGREYDWSPPQFRLGDVNWQLAILATASTLMAATLSGELRALIRSRPEPGSQNGLALHRYFEIGWRSAVAGLLVLCLTLRGLIDREYFTLPESEGILFNGDTLTQQVWWLALGIALTERLRVLSPPRLSRLPLAMSHASTLLATAAAVCIGLYIVWEMFTIAFLVHIACEGADASHSSRYWRYPIYTRAEIQWRANLGFAATGGLLASAGLLFSAVHLARQRRRYLIPLATGLVLVIAAALYSYWFYCRELPRISPDLADAGASATWFNVLGGATLVALAVTYAAYRVARRPSGKGTATAILRTHPIENSLIAVLTLAYAAVELGLSVYAERWYSANFGEAIAYALHYPNAYFMLALATISLQLLRRLWRPGQPARDPSLSIDGRLFVIAIIAFAGWTLVAVPTLFSSAFSYWLGPWYRW